MEQDMPRGKDLGVVVLLWLLGMHGLLGFHNFYLKRLKVAIAQCAIFLGVLAALTTGYVIPRTVTFAVFAFCVGDLVVIVRRFLKNKPRVDSQAFPLRIRIGVPVVSYLLFALGVSFPYAISPVLGSRPALPFFIAAVLAVAAAFANLKVLSAGKKVKFLTYLCLSPLLALLLGFSITFAVQNASFVRELDARFAGQIHAPLPDEVSPTATEPENVRLVSFDLDNREFVIHPRGGETYARNAAEVNAIAFFTRQRNLRGHWVYRNIKTGEIVGHGENVYETYEHTKYIAVDPWERYR